MKLSRRDSLARQADRISDLPDSLIHHILSFLPTTREAIHTGILSKRWRNQWRQVSVLIFGAIYGGRIAHPFHIDQALSQYGSSKVDKLQMSLAIGVDRYHDFDYSIRFAVSKEVKELIFVGNSIAPPDFVRLPEYLFCHTLLVKLEIASCTLPKFSEKKVHMKHLKELVVCRCDFPGGGTSIEIIVRGSPSLEFLNIEQCRINYLAFASKSLLKLVWVQLKVPYVGISCPNLKELSLRQIYGNLSGNKIITSFNMVRFESFGELVINSESLNKLFIEDVGTTDLAISCPMLEELRLRIGLCLRAARVENLQTLKYATLDFATSTVIEEIVPQLQLVEELTCKREFFVALLAAGEKGRHAFGGLLSKLKIIEIKGISERDKFLEGAIDFVVFLLENARVLEKLTMRIDGYSRCVDRRVYLKIWNAPRCSKHVKVKLLSGAYFY